MQNKSLTNMLHLLKMTLFSFPLLAFVACSDDLPDISWEGENLRFGTTSNIMPCGTTLEAMDEMVAELETQLEQPLPNGKKITYYWLPDDMGLSPCPSYAVGCADGLTVYTKHLFDVHEVIHSLLSPLGAKHVFWEEGMAVAFCRERLAIYSAGFDALDELEYSMTPNISRNDISFVFAGVFVRYLLDEYGIKKLKSIYNALPRSANFASLETALDNSLQDAPEDVIDTFNLSMKDCYAPADLEFAVIVPWANEGHWEHSASMNCEYSGVYGPLNDQYIENSVTLEVAVSGNYLVIVDKVDDWDLTVLLGAWDDCDWLLKEDLDGNDSHLEIEVELTEGPYELKITNFTKGSFQSDSANAITVQITYNN